MKKEILRKEYLSIRKNIEIEAKRKYDDLIFNKVINMEEYKNCKKILIYVSLKDEVDTFKIINYSLKIGKIVAVPKTQDNVIEFYEIKKIDELKPGKFGILEPVSNRIIESFKDSICIIPGVAFDEYNNRIGYGGGYYDKFLRNYNEIKIGLSYKECICEKIDVDKYDIKMDKIITN